MPKAHGEKIGASVQAVELSVERMRKQFRHHPKLTCLEYQIMQACIDEGEVAWSRGKSWGLMLEEHGYVSVLKATQSGGELFLTSMRRLHRNGERTDAELQRVRKKGGRRTAGPPTRINPTTLHSTPTADLARCVLRPGEYYRVTLACTAL